MLSGPPITHLLQQQAPGPTPEQKQEAEIKWAEKDAKESIKGATPAPQ